MPGDDSPLSAGAVSSHRRDARSFFDASSVIMSSAGVWFWRAFRGRPLSSSSTRRRPGLCPLRFVLWESTDVEDRSFARSVRLSRACLVIVGARRWRH